MIFVFHVDTGTTITFDMSYALQNVSVLMEAIERECGVQIGHQVLLMSGGESLEPSARVCSYSSGTDTNPIFLFSKALIQSNIPPAVSVDYGSDVDLNNQVQATNNLPANYNALALRAQLAQQFWTLAREQTRICEHLVHDQHLQQQGWAAVIANLEDISQTFQSRTIMLQQSFESYLVDRVKYMDLLKGFKEDLKTLEKIPILSVLRAQADGVLISEDTQLQNANITEENQNEIPARQSPEVLSLLKWISAKDNQSTLEQVAEQCSRGLEHINDATMNALKSEADSILQQANKPQLKEIGGLSDRLYGLETFMAQMRKLVTEQSELAQGLLQNQNRVTNLGDDSVLPDLCKSHMAQVQVMLNNHNVLRDIRRRITKAKEELAESIYHRLKWVMHVEQLMTETDWKVAVYQESLKRLKKHMEILQQIHLAPELYVNAVVEVVRRRTFSEAFLEWANNCAQKLLEIHNDEVDRRRNFNAKFQGHFLTTLFPGLEDCPPTFATQPPPNFDSGLPKLTSQDMELLTQSIPDMAEAIDIPNLKQITEFFSPRNFLKGIENNQEVKESNSMPVDISAKDQEIAKPDRGDLESETDTDEFEKISQAAMDSKMTSFENSKNHILQNKNSEENLGTSQEEVERLRSVILNLKTLTSNALVALKQELSLVKEESHSACKTSLEFVENITSVLNLHCNTLTVREQEVQVNMQKELGDLKQLLKGREEEIASLKQIISDKECEVSERDRLAHTVTQKYHNEQKELKKLQSVHRDLESHLENTILEKDNLLKENSKTKLLEMNSLKSSLDQSKAKVKVLEEKLSSIQVSHQKIMKETKDKLQMDFKTQLDTMRSRYKLMAASMESMERSPSETNLEKIERTDVIDLVKHEAIIKKLKEEMILEKERAILEALEKQRLQSDIKLLEEIQTSNEVIREKERDIEIYKQETSFLINDCEAYKAKLQQFSSAEIAIKNLNEKVGNLQADKARLENKISTDREILERHENLVHDLEMERDKLRQELIDERLKMSQTEIGSANLKSSNEDVRVSESKKVRLEENGDQKSLIRRVETLEVDNKALNLELNTIKESKAQIEKSLEVLESEKIRLEIELLKEKNKKNFVEELMNSSGSDKDKEMTTSVALVSDPSKNKEVKDKCHKELASCHHKDKMIKSTSNFSRESKINLNGCNPGDIVLAIWNGEHAHYTILQESSTMYFLNSDCNNALGLTFGSDKLPRKIYAFAEVVDKEYCSARKSENRYRVPQGTKFYRVRVKPIQQYPASSKNH